MATVAQKTLFLKKVFFLVSFLTFSFNSQAYSNEVLEYKVSLGALNAGNAYIKFENNPQNNTYKIIANAKTKGFARSIYAVDDSISVFGKIIDNQLVPTSHNLVLKENNKKDNKSASFDYTNDLLNYKNNISGSNGSYILLNEARDLFSTLYSLRQTVDFKDLKNDTVIDKTVIFANKSVDLKITVSPEFDLKVSKTKSIKAREVTIFAKRIRHRALSAEQKEQVLYNEVESKDFFKDNFYVKNKKDNKFEKNISVIITSDDRRIPLKIDYKTRFGTFKAIATKF
jgi:hypothetical protein|tara:strand:+ start:19 stop:873 length:855 start_codon:yes stop_codon:yes gene_type:complete